MNKVRWVAIINGLCALIWTAKVILDIVFADRASKYFVLILVLDIVCAVIWVFGFIIWNGRYHHYKEEEENK